VITGLSIEGVDESQLTPFVTSLDLSWTMDAVSQLSFTVLDQKKKMLLGNYFQIRRNLKYLDDPEFEIASHEIGGSAGEDIEHTMEVRRRPIQKMKRDKNTEGYSGITATDYAHGIADKFGLKFVGEPTATKRAVVQSASAGAKESVWDALARTAGEAKFVVFESDMTLYFCSEKWLLGKWANLTLNYPSLPTDGFQLLEVPKCRRSDNAESDIDFSASLAWQNAVNLRPGMTVSLVGLGEYDTQYLITEVSYDVGDGQPVNISARTPAKVDE
jgi:hypothetical protein